MSLPQTMNAITIRASGIDDQVEAVMHTRPLPKLRPGYFLVKVVAVALNPSDVLMIDLKLAAPGSLAGADYAGTVIEVGSDVQRDFKPGDRVCGASRNVDSRQFENGTFAEYIVVKADLQLKIPSGMGFEQAASLGVTTITTGRCFVSLPF
jgi:NADPH:quinone reductase-like Zn-dependent oxidoreductase